VVRRGNWRIDSDELENHLRGEDDVGVVIRGHLGLENALNTLLEVGLPKGLSNLENLRFPARVDLAIAMGLLDPAGRSAWLLVNELRNRVAHDLDATLDEAVAGQLEGALALRPEKTMGLIYQLPAKVGSPRERIGWAMMSLWTDVVEQITRRQPRDEDASTWE
jgi:hypothetical protein